jgi:hypothetical protein
MALGYKTGGRQKGTPNKNRAALLTKLDEAFPSYDPLLALVEIAQDPETGLSMRVDCHKTLASYIYPKMRAAEPVVANEASPLVIKIVEPQNL